MTPFLDQVARHYYAQGEVEQVCFIVPNRRAAVFFRKYLGECVAREKRPMLAPAVFTMNDFFYEASGARQTDQVHLLLELYDCYKPLYEASGAQAETLDEFIFWGGVLLADFDDVDKYLVDPERLFTNIADFRAMQDDFSFLSEEQVEAIRQFISNFNTGGEYKESFRRIWDLLLPLYHSFGKRLREKGMSTEGGVYRLLAERLKEESAADVLSARFPKVKKYVFVGHNALNECEKRLMRRLRDARLAEFCWDYGKGWISDPHNKSSLFLSQNVLEFPQAFEPDPEGLPLPEIHVLDIPSGVGQAKQLPAVLDRMGAEGIETAVVLPDESLLAPVLNSIPERIRDINVTMGCPIKDSSLYALMADVAALQMHLREKDGQWFFYHKQVWSIFSNGIFKVLAGKDGQRKTAEVRKLARYYVPQEELSGLPVFDWIFRPVVKAPAERDAQAIRTLEDYQRDLLSKLGASLRGVPGMALELDFVRDYYLAVGRLRDCELSVLPATYFRLLDKLLTAAAVPFRGEPLKGLQIMGPLETRALDFDKLIVLSCNEGTFPRRSVSASFIPAELRKGFGLPTYEYQDAVWAYYFYRMIRRAGEVWLFSDTRTEGVRFGEESRYIKQLELHFGADLHRGVLHARVGATVEQDIPKTEGDLEILRNGKLSATLLKDYLRCQAKFYYEAVRGLCEAEEVSEYLESNDIGTAFHETMRNLYSVSGGILTKSRLSSLLKGDTIREEVHRQVVRVLKNEEVKGRNIIFEEMVRAYVRKVIERDLEMLEEDGVDYMEILGVEQVFEKTIGGFHFKGRFDRVDSVNPAVVRVVDYKTGQVQDNDILITDENAAKVVAAIFNPSDSSKRPLTALQMYVYDRLIEGHPILRGRPVCNAVYQPARLHTHAVETVAASPVFLSMMEERVQGLLDEMVDRSVPFRRNGNADTTCKTCSFKTLCGR